jgi:hypothetical protein
VRDFPQSLPHGSGTAVELDPSRVLLVFSRPPVRRGLEDTLAEHDLFLEAREAGTPDVLGEVINHTETRYWVHTASGRPIDDEGLDRIEDALGQRFAFTSPVYRAPGVPGRGGYFSPLANVVLIKLREPEQGRPIEAVERLGLTEVVEKSRSGVST